MKLFLNENENCAGVYKIINIQNGRIYIGSAKNFSNRAHEHTRTLKMKKHSNRFLQFDFDKHGIEAFEFHILEVISDSIENRFVLEQKYLDEVYDDQKQCYNLKEYVYQVERTVFSKDPELTKEKLRQKSKSLWQDPEYVAKRISSLHKLNESEEYRASLSEAQKKSWADNYEERKEKVSTKAKERWEDPEYRAKCSEATLAYAQSDEGREAGRQQATKLNEKYASDSDYKAKMDALSTKNIEEYNKNRELTIKPDLISPRGEVYSGITNLREFAIEQGIDPSTMYKLVRGKAKSVKGWRLVTS